MADSAAPAGRGDRGAFGRGRGRGDRGDRGRGGRGRGRGRKDDEKVEW